MICENFKLGVSSNIYLLNTSIIFNAIEIKQCLELTVRDSEYRRGFFKLKLSLFSNSDNNENNFLLASYI